MRIQQKSVNFVIYGKPPYETSENTVVKLGERPRAAVAAVNYESLEPASANRPTVYFCSFGQEKKYARSEKSQEIFIFEMYEFVLTTPPPPFYTHFFFFSSYSRPPP